MAPKVEPQQNTYKTTEEWCRAASVKAFLPWFQSHGLSFSDKLQFQVAYDHRGAPVKGRKISAAFYYPEAATADGDGLIIVRRDTSDPVEVLARLVAPHIAAALQITGKPDKNFRRWAVRLGLEGSPSAGFSADKDLKKSLHAIAEALGPMPWGELDLSFRAVGMKPKQTARNLKCECTRCERYSYRISRDCYERVGAVCPIHGKTMKIDGLNDGEGPIINGTAENAGDPLTPQLPTLPATNDDAEPPEAEIPDAAE